jgi:hypothetical protein
METEPHVEIEEVESILVPEPGVTIEQALEEAQLSGYDELEILPNGTARILWYRRPVD